ncbi:alpha/beta fold hydrolase [Cellulomonas xylanilytica]|uniref:alpha/beta fold hydrolase n=1 Tax=Cellulomonas xylanilytica TaxID=233583 RepID=UPI0011BE2B90|nr:alpha/beta hydrolase [Cellulomonas xylanilytica]
MTEPVVAPAVPRPTRRRRWARRLLRTVVGVLAAVLALLLVLTGVNQAANAVGLARLEVPGELVEVDDDGARMHVYSRADHPGEPTLVFLAGMGLGSAYYELESVWEPLAQDVNIATVDYLGYGFSGTTAKDRTNVNVATEIHAALHGAGVEGPYVLVAHSLGGLYALEFAELYPDEVAGFVGLDSTSPGQQAPEDYEGDVSADGGLHPAMTVARFVGLVRVDRWVNGDDSSLLPANPLLDEAEQDRDWLLDNTRLDLRLLDDEGSWAVRNDLALTGHRFDAAIPTLMVLAEDSVALAEEFSMPDWVEVHEAVSSEHPDSRVVLLDGAHLIYLDAPDETVTEIREFLAATQ